LTTKLNYKYLYMYLYFHGVTRYQIGIKLIQKIKKLHWGVRYFKSASLTVYVANSSLQWVYLVVWSGLWVYSSRRRSISGLSDNCRLSNRFSLNGGFSHLAWPNGQRSRIPLFYWHLWHAGRSGRTNDHATRRRTL